MPVQQWRLDWLMQQCCFVKMLPVTSASWVSKYECILTSGSPCLQDWLRSQPGYDHQTWASGTEQLVSLAPLTLYRSHSSPVEISRIRQDTTQATNKLNKRHLQVTSLFPLYWMCHQMTRYSGKSREPPHYVKISMKPTLVISKDSWQGPNKAFYFLLSNFFSGLTPHHTPTCYYSSISNLKQSG